MIVIALIILVATLAVPVSLRSRVQSNEAATIGNLRTMSSAAESFRGTQNPAAYPATLAVMTATSPPYIDAAWAASNERQGYVYTFAAAANGETFSLAAAPRVVNISGINSYCVDQTGVIRRYAAGAAAGGDTGCDPGGTPV